MTKKIVTITFVVDDAMNEEELRYCLQEHGWVDWKQEADGEYTDFYQELSYGSAGIIVMEMED